MNTFIIQPKMALEMDESSQAELCFQLRDTKPSGGDVQLMEWSPKMDLLAAALADHSVILNRLSWQRVWTIPPHDSSVGSLVWRPDGRVLAVGCSSGAVLLYEVERADKVHQFNVHSAVTTMRWQYVELEGGNPIAYTDESTSELPPLPAVIDSASTFAADPALHDKHLEAVQIIHSMPASGLSILTVGTEDGCVHLWVGGILHAGTVRLTAENKDGGHPVVHLDVTTDLQWLIVAYRDNLHQLNVSTVSISVISDRVAELQHLAVVFSHLSSHLQYMNCAIRAMYDSWEGVLHMMENKLAGYADKLPSGVTVSDEFLMLLACGSASTELQEFLLDDLTANGLKKLGSSLQHSYNNIQKYASNHLHSVVQCVQFNLTHLLGLSSWYDRFGVLGLSRPAVEQGLKALGSFALKDLELLRVIDNSLKSIAAFSSWLYKVIVKLSDERLPDGVDESLSTEDLGLIMDFLQTRLSKPSSKDQGQFSLELVGQYFSDDNLSVVQESTSTLWSDVLQEAGIDKNCLPTLCEPCPEKSLLQLFNMLLSSIDTIFTAVADTNGSNMSVSHFGHVGVVEGEGEGHPASSIGGFVREGCHHLFFLHHSESCGVVSLDLPSGQLNVSKYNFSTFEEEADSCSLCALKYYSDESLSVAMETRKGKVIGCVLAQLSTAVLTSHSGDKESRTAQYDVSGGLSHVWQCEGFQPGMLAVSGPRRLACLLSKSHKTTKLFDAEAEEESFTEDTEDS